LTTTHTDLYPDYINTSRFNNLNDFSKAVAKIPLDFEPGSMFTYGLNQAILGRLIVVILAFIFLFNFFVLKVK